MDGAGNLLFRKRKNPPAAALSPKKILVIRRDQIGDILPATALPQILKEHFSGAELHFLTSAAGEELLRNNPYVDRVWTDSRRMRGQKYDLGFAPRGDVRDNFLMWRLGAGRRLGYGITGGGFFLTDEIPYKKGVHESRHTLDLLNVLGVHPAKLAPSIHWSAEEERRFEKQLAGQGVSGPGWIGVQVDAGTEAKQWPLENFKRFLEGLQSKFPDAKTVLVGADRARARELAGAAPGLRVVDLAGKTGLRELLYLLKRLSLFIGADSGPGHAAASFGVPVLFLYSGTNVFDEWRSLEESAEFLRNPVPCSPCHLTLCPVPGHPCMTGIAPKRAVDWVLERSRER